MSSDQLRGFVAQAMAARKKQIFQEPQEFPNAGSFSFSPPRPGRWKFVGWGPGGDGNNGATAGASGAYIEVTRYLTRKDVIAIVVGAVGSDTTITFPNAVVVTAGKASAAVAGVATGGDVNINGTAGVVTGTINGNPGSGTGGGTGGTATLGPGSGGAGAPGRLPYFGGNGAGVGTPKPGRGAGGMESSQGANGFVVAVLVGS